MTNPTQTDDLVKRLKETIEFGLFDAPNPVTFDECLAEIEYLRADLASACSQLREAALDDLAYLGQYTDWQIQAAEREAALAEIAALRAENARLRKMLVEDEIAACTECSEGHSHFPKEPNCESCAVAVDERIRAALGGENG